MKSDLRVIQEMVDIAVGIPRFTYQMNRNAPRPQGEYAAVRLSKTHKPGYDKIEYIDSPFGVMFKTTGVRILDFDILFSRDDEESDTFNNAFHRPDIREYMESKGYALMGNFPLNIKDKKFETDWEPRTGVTIRVSTVRTQETFIESIDAVEVNGDYNEGDMVSHIGPIKVGDNNESTTI